MNLCVTIGVVNKSSQLQSRWCEAALGLFGNTKEITTNKEMFPFFK